MVAPIAGRRIVEPASLNTQPSRRLKKIAVSLSGSGGDRSVNPMKPKVVSIAFGPEKVLLAEEDPLLDELPHVGERPQTLDLSKER